MTTMAKQNELRPIAIIRPCRALAALWWGAGCRGPARASLLWIAASLAPLLALVGCDKMARVPAAAAAGAARSPAAPVGRVSTSTSTSTTSRARPQVGDRRTYDVNGVSAARVGERSLTQLELSSQLAVTVVEANAARVLFLATMLAPKVGTTPTSLSPEFNRLEGDLQVPFLFELGPEGAVSSFYFSDQPSGLALGIRQWLGAALQAPVPGSGPAWTTEENDATGRYAIRYRATDTPGVFERQRLRYVGFQSRAPNPAANPLTPLPRIDKSEGTLKLAATGAVDSVAIYERARTASGQMLPIESTSRISLRTIASERVGDDPLREARALMARAVRYDPMHESSAVDGARFTGGTTDQEHRLPMASRRRPVRRR